MPYRASLVQLPDESGVIGDRGVPSPTLKTAVILMSAAVGRCLA
jgi:hypothetical protein